MTNAHLSSSNGSNETPTPSINIPQQPQENRTKFLIPKLSGGGSSVSPSSSADTMTPHELSLKKIMDLKRLHISTEPIVTVADVIDSMHEPKCISMVDLTSALNQPGFTNSIVVPDKRVVEQIDFKFNDCDIFESVNHMPIVTRDCCLNISNILDQQLKNRTKTTTPLGKILCSRFKCKSIPYVRHGFENKHKIQPFRFDVAFKMLPKK